MIATNVAGLMRMTRLCLPHIRDGGHIVNMGSIAGRQAYPNGSSYVASKFAVRGYTYALREDLLGRPIRVTTVDAGLVETEFSVVRFRGDEAAAKSVYAGHRAGHARRGGRLRPLRLDVSAAREHRRDRGQGHRAVERRPHRPRRVSCASQYDREILKLAVPALGALAADRSTCSSTPRSSAISAARSWPRSDSRPSSSAASSASSTSSSTGRPRRSAAHRGRERRRLRTASAHKRCGCRLASARRSRPG